ncbi:MAG: zf-HC2 domain-containing protein [Actinoplanes sp.]
MSTPETGGHVDMAGYVMEMLTPEEKQRADEHLAGCDECRGEIDSLREWSAKLAEVPEPMLLDGPPDDADLLLQRTLRQVRQESAGQRNRRLAVLTTAAAAILAVAIGGGILVGRGSAPTDQVAQPPTASVPAGTRTASATDPTTGARMTVSVLPAAGWVRVNATVAGIPAGEQCKLEVVGRDGTAVLAGSWLVSEAGEANGTPLNGSALIDPAEVASVRVVNTAGKQFVNVAV